MAKTKKAAPAKPALPLGEQEADITALKPHPRNYKSHPADQLEHLRASLQQYGFYRRVVVACDDTILCGHGLVEAARGSEFKRVPILRFAFGPNDKRALKLLAIDNEIGRFGETNDRVLSELLRELSAQEDISGLLGTGYDEMMLAALVMNTRPSSEITSIDAAGEWTGMPDYDNGGDNAKIIFNFDTNADRQKFVKEYGLEKHVVTKSSSAGMNTRCLSVHWPFADKKDVASVKFVDPNAHKAES